MFTSPFLAPSLFHAMYVCVCLRVRMLDVSRCNSVYVCECVCVCVCVFGVCVCVCMWSSIVSLPLGVAGPSVRLSVRSSLTSCHSTNWMCDCFCSTFRGPRDLFSTRCTGVRLGQACTHATPTEQQQQQRRR